jgi:hypothetical protein
MARPSLMEGIPDPTPQKGAKPAPQKRNVVLGAIAGILIVAAGAAYYFQTNRGPAPQPASVKTADAELREELEAKSPPPPPPAEPVEQGVGRKVQR